MVKLREFKALSLAKLMKLSKVLREKYPDKRERVNYFVNTLAVKLENLRRFTLSDYLFTLYLASQEFPEFEELVPDEEVVADLLREEE